MNKPNPILFSEHTKTADLLLANTDLLAVLLRFDLPLGFGENTIAHVCRQHNTDQHLFLIICNVYTFDDYMPDKNTLSNININALVQYLRISHRYYNHEKLPLLDRTLAKMETQCQPKHYQILRKFFDEYKEEITNHFIYEECTVFPYIRELIAGQTTVNFQINQYQTNHSNIEDKLNDLKNIIIKYLPSDCSSKERYHLLYEIFLLEKDLNKHTTIEDLILIPCVEQIEGNHGSK